MTAPAASPPATSAAQEAVASGQPAKRKAKPSSVASAISGAISGSLISACVQASPQQPVLACTAHLHHGQVAAFRAWCESLHRPALCPQTVPAQPLDVLRTKMQADAARGVTRGTLTTARIVLTDQVWLQAPCQLVAFPARQGELCGGSILPAHAHACVARSLSCRACGASGRGPAPASSA
jgi:hypothetical protein